MSAQTLSAVLVMALGGLGTFLIRLSFLQLFGVHAVPALVQRLLRYVPAATLPALVAPAVLYERGDLVVSLANPELIAALVALLAGIRTRSMLVVLGAGMGALWLQTWLAQVPGG